MIINIINIHINLLKTSRRRNCMSWMCGKRVSSHTWSKQVDCSSINQVLYSMQRATQCSVSCPWVWWYKHCSCRWKWGGIRSGRAYGVRKTIKPVSQSFLKSLVKVKPNGENCLTGLWSYGLGGWGVVALGYGGCACILVRVMKGGLK